MKGQSKRFVNHKGQAYEIGVMKNDDIGFFDLVCETLLFLSQIIFILNNNISIVYIKI